ncbi:hypothetical protein MWU59_04585 [Flavobacteriaceae bacterium F08102]|nr:hypothetical protein [Flavobacteriaceae bacterium F08102]
MKRSLIFGFFVSSLILGIIYYIDAKSQPDLAFFTYKLSSDELDELNEGDLILRRGYGLLSTLIMKMMNEDYPVTHLGVILKKQHTFYVVHSLSSSVSDVDGIQMQRLDSFVNNSYPNTIMVSRLKNIHQDQIGKIKQRLAYYLKKKVPFDHYFNAQDTTAFYCSELVWKVFEKDLDYLRVDSQLSDDDKYASLKFFYSPKYFDIIINHHE